MIPIKIKRSILVYQDYTFRIPWYVDYEVGRGCVVTVNAVAGLRVFSNKIHDHDECYIVTGPTLFPSWKRC